MKLPPSGIRQAIDWHCSKFFLARPASALINGHRILKNLVIPRALHPAMATPGFASKRNKLARELQINRIESSMWREIFATYGPSKAAHTSALIGVGGSTRLPASGIF